MDNTYLLEDAIAFATSLIEGPGDNPAFFDAWRRNRAKWQAFLDQGRHQEGAEAAYSHVRRIYIQVADLHEARSDLSGLSVHSSLYERLEAKLREWKVLVSGPRLEASE